MSAPACTARTAASEVDQFDGHRSGAQRVGDDESVEPELVFEQPIGRRCERRRGVPGQVGDANVRHHDADRIVGEESGVGDEITSPQIVEWRGDGDALVGVDADRPQPGEVLEDGKDAGTLHGVDEQRGPFGHDGRVVAVGPVAEGAATDGQHRGEVEVDSGGRHAVRVGRVRGRARPQAPARRSGPPTAASRGSHASSGPDRPPRRTRAVASSAPRRVGRGWRRRCRRCGLRRVRSRRRGRPELTRRCPRSRTPAEGEPGRCRAGAGRCRPARSWSSSPRRCSTSARPRRPSWSDRPWRLRRSHRMPSGRRG